MIETVMHPSERAIELAHRERFERAIAVLLDADIIAEDAVRRPECGTEHAEAAKASVSINLASPKHRKNRKE